MYFCGVCYQLHTCLHGFYMNNSLDNVYLIFNSLTTDKESMAFVFHVEYMRNSHLHLFSTLNPHETHAADTGHG